MGSNTAVDSKVIEKIKKLLALAKNSAATEAEAALAMERATEILTKNGLDMLDLHEHEKPPVGELGYKFNGAEPWRRHLLNQLAVHNFCKAILVQTHGAFREMLLIGRADNIATVTMLFEWIAPQVARIAREETKAAHEAGTIQVLWSHRSKGRGWSQRDEAGAYKRARSEYERSCRLGIVLRIRNRLLEARKASEANSTTTIHSVTALVKVENQAIQIYIDNKYGRRVTQMSSTPSVSAAGFAAGKAAGDRVSLTRSSQVRSGAPALASGR